MKIRFVNVSYKGFSFAAHSPRNFAKKDAAIDYVTRYAEKLAIVRGVRYPAMVTVSFLFGNAAVTVESYAHPDRAGVAYSDVAIA